MTKGTYAKMARGEMVRFMAENSIENPEDIKKFDRLGYAFRYDLSSDTEYIFERRIEDVYKRQTVECYSIIKPVFLHKY